VKTIPSIDRSSCDSPPPRRRQGGFAVLVVMILLLIMVSLALGNNVALARLQSELQLVEQRQQRQRLSVSGTNLPGTARITNRPPQLKPALTNHPDP